MGAIAVFSVIVPLVAAVISYPLGRVARDWKNALVIAAFALNALLALGLLVGVLASGPFSATLFSIAVPGYLLPIKLTADLLTASLMLVMAAVVLVVALCSASASQPRNQSACSSLLLLAAGGLNGFVLSWDLISLYVFWEVVSLAFFFLVMIDLEPRSMLAGLRLLVTNEVAGLSLLLGTVLTLTSLNATEIGQVSGWLCCGSSGTREWVLLLFLVALAVRSGLVPTHSWLLGAVAVSRPAVVTLLLSAFNLMGLLAMLRLLSQVFVADAAWAGVIGVLGMASVITGGYLALRQTDVWRLFGYYSVGQFGFVAIGLSLGNDLGVAAALSQLIALALVLPLLLLSFWLAFHEQTRAGLSHETLGGWHVAAVALVVGGMAAVGLPPLMGFGPRWLLLQAGLSVGSWWAYLVMLVAVLGMGLGALLFIRLLPAVLGCEMSTGDQRPVALSPPTGAVMALAFVVAVAGIPWVLYLTHAVGPMTALVTADQAPQLLPLGWPGVVSLLLVYVGVGLGVVAYLVEAGVFVAVGRRASLPNALQSIGGFTASLTGAWWRLVDEGGIDLSSAIGALVLGLARLVSELFLIVTRRIGGW